MDNYIFVGHWPPPFGGISSHLKLLLPEIASRGNNVLLINISNTSSLAYQKHFTSGITLITINPKLYFFRKCISIILLFLPVALGLRPSRFAIKPLLYGAVISHVVNSLIESFSRNNLYSFVFTHDNDKSLANLFLSDCRRVFVFNVIYADFILHSRKYFPIKNLYRKAFSLSDSLLSCSKFCVSTASEYLDSYFPTHVFYNNVDSRKFNPSNDPYKVRLIHDIPLDSFVLLYLARMNKSMGLDFLLEIKDDLFNLFPDLYLMIVGASSTHTDLALKASLENPQLHCATNIDDNLKPFYYSSCDVFTAPSMNNHACMGISNIEAMMSGKAVLSSDSGGHKETIDHNKSGYIVPFSNDNTLSKEMYIQYLSQLYNSMSLRNSFGQHARERALRLFSNEVIVNQHISFANSFK